MSLLVWWGDIQSITNFVYFTLCNSCYELWYYFSLYVCRNSWLKVGIHMCTHSISLKNRTKLYIHQLPFLTTNIQLYHDFKKYFRMQYSKVAYSFWINRYGGDFSNVIWPTKIFLCIHYLTVSYCLGSHLVV